MANDIFDKSKTPDEAVLSNLLGPCKTHWDAILEHVEKANGRLVREWKFYGAKYGWQLKVADRKHALVYLIPHQGSFLAAMGLNEKAVAALKASTLPGSLVHEVESAKAYPEGRPARIEVTGPDQAEIVRQLLDIKLATW